MLQYGRAIGLREFTGRNGRAIAQNRKSLAKEVSLFQEMADVDHTDPICSQALNHIKQVFCVSLGKATRRLVHDEDLWCSNERASYFNKLLLRNRQAIDGYPERYSVLFQFAQGRPCDFESSPSIHPTACLRLLAQDDIFFRRKVACQV